MQQNIQRVELNDDDEIGLKTTELLSKTNSHDYVYMYIDHVVIVALSKTEQLLLLLQIFSNETARDTTKHRKRRD